MSKKKVARDETLESDIDEIESFEESDTNMDVISESGSSIIDDDNDDLIEENGDVDCLEVHCLKPKLVPRVRISGPCIVNHDLVS